MPIKKICSFPDEIISLIVDYADYSTLVILLESNKKYYNLLNNKNRELYKKSYYEWKYKINFDDVDTSILKLKYSDKRSLLLNVPEIFNLIYNENKKRKKEKISLILIDCLINSFELIKKHFSSTFIDIITDKLNNIVEEYCKHSLFFVNGINKLKTRFDYLNK